MSKNKIEKELPKWILILISIFEVGLIIYSTCAVYSPIRDLTNGTPISFNAIILVFVLIISIYVTLIIGGFKKRKLDSNRIILLITILIFYFSLFAGITIFKNNQPLSYAPRLPNGTVGFRSWKCDVTFTDINIAYTNSSNKFYWLDSIYVNDPSNWAPAFKSPVKEENFDTVTIISNCYFNDKGDFFINLINKGVKFNPPDSLLPDSLKDVTFVRVIAKVKADSSWYEFGDTQICLNVPLNTESEELYLGFSLNIKDIFKSKFWIPALDWHPGNSYRDPISSFGKSEIKSSILEMESCYLTALSFQNTIRLQIKKVEGDETRIICESQIRE